MQKYYFSTNDQSQKYMSLSHNRQFCLQMCHNLVLLAMVISILEFLLNPVEILNQNVLYLVLKKLKLKLWNGKTKS